MVEKLEVMDTVTKFRKQETYTVSKTLAIVILCLFVICIVAAGLLGYSVTSCKNYDNVQPETSIVLCNDETKDDVTSPITTTSRIEPDTSTAKITSSTTTTTERAEKTEQNLDLRLPRSIVPHSYKLRLIPFLEEGNFTFKGEVKILINVTEACSNITLHADDLNIESVDIFDGINKTVTAVNTTLIKKLQFLIIQLDQEIKPNERYYVHIKFEGFLNDFMQGFYRSSYQENNQTKWIALTQFQPTDARRAFPCFDEPGFKARFQISIARFKHMNSISNMKKIGISTADLDLPNYEWDHYEESVPMSSYLLAFMVSEFKSVSNGTFSIWARSGALPYVKYALSIGPTILKYYEDFFGIKYPLPKLDMAAIPDFSAGAMENWGLITYREPTLLYEEGVSSIATLQRVAHIVAHELAHQWFGNLVTPYWWSDLWLNEGFATYVEYLGADNVAPEWKQKDTFVVDELHSSLDLDTLKTSHQISIPIKNPMEINDIFDTISYSKGASIIRMMQQFLGEKVFQKGLNKYLNSKLYGSATQDDLWKTLTEQGLEDGTLEENMSVKEIMDTWTLQTGYPVILVSRDYDAKSVTITQRRFLLEKTNQTENLLWWVPISYTDKIGLSGNVWLRKIPEVRINNIKTSSDDWMLVNVNQTGYYRVNYDLRNWQLIINQLKENHKAFDPKNRAQILDDVFALAYSGHISYELALNVTLYLNNEREYITWSDAKANLYFLKSMFVRSAHFDKFKAYTLRLIDSFYKEVGFKDIRDPLLSQTQYHIVSMACSLGMRDCIIKAVEMFQNWKNSANPDSGNDIPRDLRYIVYCTAISDGGQEEWDFAWERYLKIDAGDEKEVLLKALGCTKEVWLLNRFLEWSLTEKSGIRKHDMVEVFDAITINPVGQDLTYRFFKTNWDRIRKYVGATSLSLSGIVSSSITHLKSELEIEDFKTFLKLKYDEFGVALRVAQQSVERAEADVKWRKKYFNTIVEWLSKSHQYT